MCYWRRLRVRATVAAATRGSRRCQYAPLHRRIHEPYRGWIRARIHRPQPAGRTREICWHRRWVTPHRGPRAGGQIPINYSCCWAIYRVSALRSTRVKTGGLSRSSDPLPHVGKPLASAILLIKKGIAVLTAFEPRWHRGLTI